MNNSGTKADPISHCSNSSAVVGILAVAIAYAVVARGSFLFTIPPGNISPIFPAAGIALAGVMILGRKAMVGVWLGSFVANTIFFSHGTAPSVQALLVGAFIGIGAMSGAGAGAFLVRRFCKGEQPLHSGWNVLMLVTVGALGCCMVSPTFGVLSLSLGGYIPWERFGYSWVTWWVGDSIGALVAAPLILAWHHQQPFHKNPWRILEATLLGGVTLLVCYYVFFRNTPFEYGLLPLLLLAAFRFGMRGATTALAAIAILATIGTSHRSSPFVGQTVNESLLRLYSFFGVTILCALFMAGVMAERKLAGALLSGQKQVLEMIVAGASLPEQLTVLVRFIESQTPGVLGSILLLDEDGVHVRHGAGPSLPAEFLAAVDGRPIGPQAGSCGTAAYRKEAVLVEDIASDPLWAEYKAAALRHGLRACWSTPIFDAHRQVLGTFAMYYRQPGLPKPEHQRFIDIATHIAAIAISNHRDITERKHAEESLRTSEEQFRETFYRAGVGKTQTEPATRRFLRINPAFCEFTGYTEAELLEKTFVEITLPEDREGDRLFYERLLRREISTYSREKRYLRKDGTVVWGHVFVTILFDHQGRASLASADVQDITKRKHTEKALRESERKYRELVENANSIILHWTRDGRIIFLNEFGQQFFGYTEEEIRGRHIIGTLVPETESSGRDLRTLLDEVSANPAAFERNVNENIRRNGERIWIAWANKVVLDEQHRVAEILSIGSDITERKRAEEQISRLHEKLQRYAEELERRVEERTAELAAARDRAESADRVKSSFLATMSHELRTPLNSIIGFTGLLLQGLAGPLNAEQTKQLRMIKGSGQHLLALINDVLDISKIEAGQIEIREAPFDLRESIQKVVRTVTPLADKKQLPLITQIAPDICQITSDCRRVEQILLNLLSNAIKFTECGGITLIADFQPAATTEGLPLVSGASRVVRLAVRDTGIGIKPEDVDKLFKPFHQLDTGLARQHEGTGLGLAICKRLVQRLGGVIEVQSDCGKGSTFQFTLPFIQAGNYEAHHSPR